MARAAGLAVILLGLAGCLDVPPAPTVDGPDAQVSPGCTALLVDEFTASALDQTEWFDWKTGVASIEPRAGALRYSMESGGACGMGSKLQFSTGALVVLAEEVEPEDGVVFELNVYDLAGASLTLQRDGASGAVLLGLDEVPVWSGLAPAPPWQLRIDPTGTVVSAGGVELVTVDPTFDVAVHVQTRATLNGGIPGIASLDRLAVERCP
jgi:hypothetical protein